MFADLRLELIDLLTHSRCFALILCNAVTVCLDAAVAMDQLPADVLLHKPHLQRRVLREGLQHDKGRQQASGLDVAQHLLLNAPISDGVNAACSNQSWKK